MLCGFVSFPKCITIDWFCPSYYINHTFFSKMNSFVSPSETNCAAPVRSLIEFLSNKIPKTENSVTLFQTMSTVGSALKKLKSSDSSHTY